MRQTNIYDFLEDKDWIDQVYFVYKAKQKREWTEYSPKFLTQEDAKEWRLTKGEYLVDRFDRQLKMFTARPSDHTETWTLVWEEELEPGMIRLVSKRVPGENFDDAVDNVRLFVPQAMNVSHLICEK
jgi:hypothetical protein